MVGTCMGATLPFQSHTHFTMTNMNGHFNYQHECSLQYLCFTYLLYYKLRDSFSSHQELSSSFDLRTKQHQNQEARLKNVGGAISWSNQQVYVEIHSTVGKRAKRMPHPTVETTILDDQRKKSSYILFLKWTYSLIFGPLPANPGRHATTHCEKFFWGFNLLGNFQIFTVIEILA